MSAKQVLYGSDARQKVLRGATKLVDAMRVTLGPMARSVLIGRKWGVPIVCDDGVTIAKEFELKDAEEDLGARMIRQAAEKTSDIVGDGTTTAALLAHSIYAEGLRNVAAGASAIRLKRGLERGLAVAVASIRKRSRQIATLEEKRHIATVSAHGDEAIGALVAEAIDHVGAEGVVTVEDAKTAEATLEFVEGMQLDRGTMSPYFITDPVRVECVLEDAQILLHDGKIRSMKDMVPLLEGIAKTGTPLLVVAEDLETEALATLILNRVRGMLSVAAIKAPGFGDRRKAMLRDLAVLTGGEVISEELGTSLEKVTPEMLGRASKIVVGSDATTIIGGMGAPDAIAGRIDELRRQLDDVRSTYDREKLAERIAKLTGGVAVLRVGAASETELKKQKEAFDDAIAATKAAVEEGIVPGGGVALLRAVAALKREVEHSEGDERTGLRVLARALETPLRQIADNSGVDPGVVVQTVAAHDDAFGYDAGRDKYGDLAVLGIIDPTKVVRTALENAVSVAGVLLLTEVTLTEEEEPAPTNESAI